MGDLLDAMVRARSAWTSSTVRGWYSEQDLCRHLRAALADEARWVGDVGFGRAFRDAVGLPGIPDPLDWANRAVELPGGGWAVTHLRFRLGDVARPFVDVVATTAPPTPDGLALVAGTVLPAYAPFRPVSLRIEVPDGAGLLAALGSDDRFGRCGPALHVVAGRVEDLLLRPRAGSYPSVRLRPTDPGGAAERAEAAYAELAAGRPQSRAWAAAESVASLSACAEEGLLFEVVVDGQVAGVVAAARDDDHGLVGSTVRELCLDSRHRGRRLAAAVLQRLVDELPARPGDVLWGTVHPGNRPSLRTALSIGRTTTSSLLWVAPRGHPGMPVEL
ncbi:GNAT family N-acetyltransferase [Pseudokineococcus marinus]|uniref:GNAT family N-acetyltransferase n=1 Tax=Pseudokineococcus marinus TaxID=351215 RepID=A0A849BRF0_9ACTN|nr:GNAT family N-acetyltransferase [Pseudokineococcus marinus]NNH22096.1 GNAT family N-acetyltransferase [Pseudokineococcus marinus]